VAEKPDLRIGAAVAALRKQRGMTQHTLAERFGVGSAQIISTIGGSEGGGAAHLARILNVSLGDLLGGRVSEDPYVLWRTRHHDMASS
jgi:transcriptional regulator with XRE-family HTH domain